MHHDSRHHSALISSGPSLSTVDISALLDHMESSSSVVNTLAAPAQQSVPGEVLFPKSFVECFFTDPFIKEAAMKVAKNPAMQKTRNFLRSGKFNEEELYPCDMMDADALELLAAAEESMKGLLERHPSMEEEFDKIKEHMEDPVYKSIAENTTDPITAMIRYFNSKGKALGFSVRKSADDEAFGLIREVPKEYIAHEAASLGDVKGLKEALKTVPDINKKDNKGITALIIACLLDKSRCAKILIEAGTEVNALDENGNTPLHYAAWNGMRNCVWLLLKHGADITLQNNEGLTPYQLAKEAGQIKEVLKLIKRPRTLSVVEVDGQRKEVLKSIKRPRTSSA